MTGQNSKGQDMTGQDKTGEDKTEQKKEGGQDVGRTCPPCIQSVFLKNESQIEVNQLY